jgi:DNA polymerase/3'-5' exonuclease PolX
MFRAMAYGKAATTIGKLDFVIQSVEQLKGIKGIGTSIRDKISQILENGMIENNPVDTKDTVRSKMLTLFQTIHGIGPAAAKKLYDVEKITTIDKLKSQNKKDPNLLTHAQKIGLKYREEFLNRIDRSVICECENMIKSILNEYFVQEFKIMTAGSYRRGKSSSGDMDIMLCSDTFLLSEAIEVLISRGLIIDILALDKKKFMGVAQIHGNDPFRIDIFMVSKENWWVAMVTHTGPKELNTQMRTIASTMGMKLSDQGLKKGTEKIPIKSEADLFLKLNMEPIKPTKR